ncbi:MAG: hypothetical protein ABI768_09705 [Acidobacteriota bacterium]
MSPYVPGVVIAVLLGSPPVAAPTPPAQTGGPATAKPAPVAGQKASPVAAAAGVLMPLTIRTAPFAVTGIGALAAAPAFTPLDVRTQAFSVTGTGALVAPPPFTPVDVRTQPFTVTGTTPRQETPR